MPHPAQAPVLVGIDGSPTSELATAIAFDEASRRRVDLIALHAWTEFGVGDFLGMDWLAMAVGAERLRRRSLDRIGSSRNRDGMSVTDSADDPQRRRAFTMHCPAKVNLQLRIGPLRGDGSGPDDHDRESGRYDHYAVDNAANSADHDAGYEYPELYRTMFGEDFVPPPHQQAEYRRVRKHRWYMAPRLVTVNDLYSFEQGVKLSVDDFTDVIGRHFRQPKEGLGYDGSRVAHMWRTAANPDAPL